MAPKLLNAFDPPESDRLQATLQKLETDTDTVLI